MKLSALIIASGLVTGLNGFKLTFYSGPSCRSANLGSYESNFHVCGYPPANSRSVIISNSIPEDSARQMHFYNHPQFGGCSGTSVVARSGCVTLDGSIKGWQSQHLGTSGKRDAVPVEFEG